MWSGLLFLAFIATSAAETTNVSPCTNFAAPLPISTTVVGCVEPPCQLRQLEDAIINMEFKAPYEIQNLQTLVTAYLRVGPISIPVPYDLQEAANTCNFLTDASCPVSADQVLQYSLRMYIEPIFPVGTQANLEFRVVDDNRTPITCIRLGIEILAPLTSLP